MARLPREHRLETRDARAKLPARGEPYWRQIVPGTFLGFRKGKRTAAWIARQRTGDGYAEQRIGTADDQADADGDVVLSYAQAVARTTSTQVEARGSHPRHYGAGLTLNQVFDTYLKERQTTPGGRFNRVLPPSTAKVSGQFWERHARDGIGAQLVTALDAKALRQWHAKLATIAPTVRGKAQTFDKGDADQMRSRRATANRILTIAKASLSWARKHDALPTDMPDWWRNVSPFGLGDDPTPRMLDTDEITRLLNAAPVDLRTLLQGALMTGCRYSELRTMRVRDFDSDQGSVTIRQSKSYKTLQQPLTPEGVRLFDRQTAGRKKDAFIFTRAYGTEWAQKDAIRPMRAAVVAADLEDASFKTMRATYGKLLLLATKDIELVAKALGHSDSRITRKHYAALLPSEVKAGISKLPSLGFDTDSTVSRIGRKRRTG